MKCTPKDTKWQMHLTRDHACDRNCPADRPCSRLPEPGPRARALGALLGKPRRSKTQPRRKTITFQIRRACPSDWDDVKALAITASYRSPDLGPWEGSLRAPGFVVAELDGKLAGALLARMDVGPVAWVRMAAATEHLPLADWILASLSAVRAPLTKAGADTLAWMDSEGWTGPILRRHGFQTATRVITLAKTDRTTPRLNPVQATLRSATKPDYGTVAAIDRAAFDPLWWRSEESVCRHAATASRFLVAELRGMVVGYAEREQHACQGHVNRLAVSPSQQARGIGGALLRATLERLWDGGAEIVSLNTQATNHASRRLYERFGFVPTGDSATVWALALNRRA